MNFKDGTVYEGTFYHNDLSGLGKLTWGEQVVYEGKIDKGYRHGNGTYINKVHQIIYEGNWRWGRIQGYGKIYYQNGSRYEGEFDDGYRHGKGIMYYTNGNFYDGEWKNNCKNGWGTMNWKNCCQKYEGTWKHDMPNGFGSYLWLLNNSEHSFLRNRYEGNFVNGTRQGLGTYYYANGSKYEGDWNDNIKEGCAIFTEENGNVITGFFEVDRLFKRIFNGAVLNVTAEANTLIFQNLDDVDARSILEDGISKHNLDDPFRPLDTNTNIDLEGIPGTQDNLQVTQSNLGHTMTDIGMKKQGTLNQLAEGDRTSQANLMQSNAFGQSNMKDTLNVEHHENGNNKRGRKKHKGPIDINPNPYFNILNLDDLYDTQPSLKVKTYPWVMKMLLSRHSDLIRLYSYYRKKYEPLDENKEIGTGLRLFSFWRFLIECRLLNINLSIPSFNRLYSVNKRNTYT